MGKRKQMKRVSEAMQVRRDNLAKELKKDFTEAVYRILSQLSDKDLSQARGLEITYEINDGKISRISDATWTSTHNKKTRLSIKKRKYGFYVDVFPAFQAFTADLYLQDMGILKPQLPERNAKNGRIKFVVRFDA